MPEELRERFPKCLAPITVAVYILSSVIATVRLLDGMPSSLAAAYALFLGVGALLVFVNKKDFLFSFSYTYATEYLFYLLLMFGATSILYGLFQSPFSQIVRGYEKLVFQAIMFAVSVFAIYCFGRKAVDYTLYSLSAFFMIAIVFAYSKTGLSEAISSIRFMIASRGEADSFMKYLELHDAMFAFGILAIYYIIVDRNALKATMCLGPFLIGFKRIAFLAIAAALVYGLASRRMRFSTKANLVVGFLILICSFVYLFAVRTGGFSAATSSVGVDDMGRTELYSIVSDEYELAPWFLGHGFEYITQFMAGSDSVGRLNMAKIGAIHNSYLTIFIEFGFWGYLLWMWYWLLHHVYWTDRFGSEAVSFQMTVLVYLFITYMTDNTSFYFTTGLCANIATMTVSLASVEKRHVSS